MEEAVSGELGAGRGGGEEGGGETSGGTSQANEHGGYGMIVRVCGDSVCR